MKKLFVYGSLLLPGSPFVLAPKESVFIKGYKLVVLKSEKSSTNYHFIKIIETKKEDDLVCGYLVEVPEEWLPHIDNYEGSSYERKEVSFYSRRMEKSKCFAYIAKENPE